MLLINSMSKYVCVSSVHLKHLRSSLLTTFLIRVYIGVTVIYTHTDTYAIYLSVQGAVLEVRHL